MDDVLPTLAGPRTVAKFRQPTSLVDEVVRLLTDRIVSGDLQPGTRLVEERLAEELGISRPPIREAFRVLQHEGLLDLAPRQGVRVHHPTLKEISDIYVCREALEGLSARLAAQQFGPGDIEALDGTVGAMRDALTSGDVPGFLRANVRFHQLLGAASGNDLLVELIRTLGTRVLQLRFLSLSMPGQMGHSLSVHQEIVDALRNRDANEAERLTKQLIARARTVLLKSLSDVPSTPG